MMKRIACLIYLILYVFTVIVQEKFQLAPPLMKFPSVFFTHEAKIILTFAQPGTTIRYTTDGKEPDEHSTAYTAPVIIKNNFTTLKAKVFGKDFMASETVQATFVKDGLPLIKVDFPPPHEKYPGQGPNTLMDNKGGMADFGNSTWLGFRQDSVTITITLDKKRKINTVLFNVLQDQGSWIFFPYKAEVFSTDGRNTGYKKQGELFFIPAENTDVSVCRAAVVRFKEKIKTDTIKLNLYLLKKIPDWHPGKGQPGWIFIDEVKLY